MGNEASATLQRCIEQLKVFTLRTQSSSSGGGDGATTPGFMQVRRLKYIDWDIDFIELLVDISSLS
jgi:hypothetical protein